MDKNNYRLGMYEKAIPYDLSWEEKLNITKECGFDWLEISIDETDEKLSRLEWDDNTINSLKRDMEKTGVSIDTMCLSGHRKYPLGSLDDAVEKRSLEIMEKAIILAKKLGVRIIQLAGYDEYYNESNNLTKQKFIKNLSKSVLLAAKHGVILGFETMETSFMDTINKSLEYVNLLNSPYLKVYPDIGNITNASILYNFDVNDDIRLGKGNIVAAHLKETIPNHYREIPFNSGHVKFEENIKTLLEIGVRMFVCEFWYKGEDNFKEIAKFNSKFIRDKFESL